MKKIKLIERSKNIVCCDLSGAKVILNTETLRPYILNETASLIWDLCKKPIDVDSIAARISRDYKVKAGTAKKDVSIFINNMKKRKVITLYERKDKI